MQAPNVQLNPLTQTALATFVSIPHSHFPTGWKSGPDHGFPCGCNGPGDIRCNDDTCWNRASKCDCSSTCGGDIRCANQRFIRQQYAKVSVIETDRKGYGLSAGAPLGPDQFIIEYVGEIIDKKTQVSRKENRESHLYFMELKSGWYIDASKKGNLARFINHSCNPNCRADKWSAGGLERIGIFAQRAILPGEELTFDYRDKECRDWCSCGELNCLNQGNNWVAEDHMEATTKIKRQGSNTTTPKQAMATLRKRKRNADGPLEARKRARQDYQHLSTHMTVDVSVLSIDLNTYNNSSSICQSDLKSHQPERSQTAVQPAVRYAEKSYSCDLCNKDFATRFSLTRHETTHTKPYCCHLCEKTCAGRDEFTAHGRLHEDLYSCDLCKKVFARRDSVTRHKRLKTCTREKIRSD